MPKKNGYRMGTRRNRRQEDSVDYKHERCSNSLVVREIQMRTIQWHIFSHLSDCQKLKTWPHQRLAKCGDFYTVPLGMKIGKMTLGKTFSFFHIYRCTPETIQHKCMRKHVYTRMFAAALFPGVRDQWNVYHSEKG